MGFDPPLSVHGWGTGSGRPPWIRVSLPGKGRYAVVGEVVRSHGLLTVCKEARCPNMPECWGRGVATFLVLGGMCTRNCRFCAVGKGVPFPPDPGEPRRIAEAVRVMGLRHAVITSVTRDDLPDGGASIFAGTIREVRSACPGAAVEVLVPDFGGSVSALDKVIDAGPAVLAHNIETVPRLYQIVRPGAGATSVPSGSSKGRSALAGVLRSSPGSCSGWERPWRRS